MSEKAPSRCEFDAEELILRLDLSVPAEVGGIDPAVERIMGVVSSMECGSGKEFEIETALREALANAIVHGCKGDPAKRIQVAVGCDESRGMLIVVRDPGCGFDPRSIPSPTAGQNLYRSHGRGIYLINELMDEVRFEKGGTEIWMRKL
jgi:serine/threonine-protein kinase RsbW